MHFIIYKNKCVFFPMWSTGRAEIESAELGPSRATARLRKPFSLSPVTTSFRGCRDWVAYGTGGRDMGRAVFLTIWLWALESLLCSPSGIRAEPWSKMDFMHIRLSVRSHLEHLFQYLWVMAGPAKHHGAQENFPPFPRLDRPVLNYYRLCSAQTCMRCWCLCRYNMISGFEKSSHKAEINATVTRTYCTACYKHTIHSNVQKNEQINREMNGLMEKWTN